ncbi:vWA domain-containing protein [Humibacillus xanthopallidus]|uniref:von Willebrand factor type A domain-containing protein n=1 Tax=Humibacillus xanthopallidus TaxID=412689 RepID=A0A543HG75_9MICO|nr:vWA domain-containing protein [Humibacillus xanthopallidus]TQM57293.1 von Willebrand factor type A domain-containing protein [Humibacillus xanthopallidus]
MHTATRRRLVPARIRSVAAVIAATALTLGGVAMAPMASAAPTPDATASPTSVARYGTSTVTLTLDGESSTQSTPTDLVLVLDESGSIDATEFNQLNTFASSVVTAVAADGLFANGGRVGVVGFSSGAETVIPLSNNQAAVASAISSNPQSALSTCISCGLNQASAVMGVDDPARNQLVIVITDGNADGGDPTAAAATSLQAKAEVFAVGVGDGISQSTLETIASGAGDANTFAVGGFGSLAALLSTLVAAVVVPGATNPSVTVTLDAGWDLVPGSVSAGLGATVSGVTTNGFTVSRDDLGDENLVITYGIKHEGAPCGPLNVNSSVVYTDDEDATVTFPPVVVTVNCLPPVADAGPDKTVAEGSNVSLDGSGSHDPDGTITAYAWSGADPAIGTLSDTSSTVATYAGLDDGVDAVTLGVTDDNGLTDTDSTDVTVTNVAPSLTLTSCPVAPNQVGTDVSFAGTFTDPGVNDTHTMTVDWGDGVVSPATAATSPVGATHQYASAGIFDIAVTVTDDDGGSDTETCGFVVVFDPDGGFVTGGGWITSPAGAYPADPGASGRANFGFVSKYQKGATVPTGSTEFQFQAGNLNFHSSDYQWLVVAGTKAQYKGTGSVNGVSGYSFMLTATDGSPDRLRMKIWKTSDSTIVYDNQIGSGDTTNPTTALSGGQIVIHKG